MPANLLPPAPLFVSGAAQFCEKRFSKLLSGLGHLRLRTCNGELHQVSGGYTTRATPVPIPNTEVKPRWADDTARVTAWERRSLPGLNYKRLQTFRMFGAFLFSPRHFVALASCRRFSHIPACALREFNVAPRLQPGISEAPEARHFFSPARERWVTKEKNTSAVGATPQPRSSLATRLPRPLSPRRLNHLSRGRCVWYKRFVEHRVAHFAEAVCVR